MRAFVACPVPTPSSTARSDNTGRLRDGVADPQVIRADASAPERSPPSAAR